MKKLLFVFLVSFIFIGVSFATDIYYTDYGVFSEYSSEVVVSNELINVISETRYNWYKETSEKIGYSIFNQFDKFDIEDCYESAYSDWSDEFIESNEGNVVESRNIYKYYTVLDVKIINFYNFYSSEGFTDITDIVVTYKGEIVDFSYSCNDCNDLVINNGGSIKLELSNKYPIHEVDVTISFKDINISYNMTYETSGAFIYGFTQFSNISDFEYTHNVLTNNNLVITDWAGAGFSTVNYINDYHYDKYLAVQYRSKNLMCMEYEDVILYSDNYYKEQYLDYEKGEEVEFYAYQMRDKIVVDFIDVIDKNFILNDLVIFSSAFYEITSDLNLDYNGVYNVLIKVDDLEISKELVVNIDDNLTKDEMIDYLNNELLTKDEEIKNLKEIIADLTNELLLNQEMLNDLSNELIMKQVIIDNLNKEIYEYQNYIELLLKEISDLNLEIDSVNLKLCDCEDDCEALENELAELLQKFNSKNNLVMVYEDKILELDEQVIIAYDDFSDTYLENEILKQEVIKLEQLIADINCNTSSSLLLNISSFAYGSIFLGSLFLLIGCMIIQRRTNKKIN